MAELVPEEVESTYANEGTAAHALAELMARDQILGTVTKAQKTKALKEWRTEFKISDDAEAEMTEHGQGYVDYLRERMAELPDSVLLLEQRLPTGLPDSWGTSDAVIVSPTSVDSVDFKGLYKGTVVDAPADPVLYARVAEAFPAAEPMFGFGDFLLVAIVPK